jgi:hypothetical protein
MADKKIANPEDWWKAKFIHCCFITVDFEPAASHNGFRTSKISVTNYYYYY